MRGIRLFGELNIDNLMTTRQDIELAILKSYEKEGMPVSFIFTATDFNKVLLPIRSRTINIQTEKELEQEIKKIRRNT